MTTLDTYPRGRLARPTHPHETARVASQRFGRGGGRTRSAYADKNRSLACFAPCASDIDRYLLLSWTYFATGANMERRSGRARGGFCALSSVTDWGCSR